ncbi:ASCH domain-containing protein [Candidatus Woesearchaeota archaeon]|nr:ASCH domain-containing protein [Candidatus Woesearchaeota archaeon]
MHHLAILKKEYKLLDLILKRKKTIESRWYQTRRTPYNNIKPGDTVFFKESGQPVSAKATVSKVLQFNLKQTKAKDIVKKYGKHIGINYSKKQEKNYCILIFLKNPKSITPFNINKKGYGLMSAWITVNNIKELF